MASSASHTGLGAPAPSSWRYVDKIFAERAKVTAMSFLSVLRAGGVAGAAGAGMGVGAGEGAGAGAGEGTEGASGGVGATESGAGGSTGVGGGKT